MSESQPHSQQPDAPPSYAMATGSSTTSNPSNTTSGHLEVPKARNGISAQQRRSMEDEQRPLPEGWLRQWDSKEQHQFFVDTKADPPRSIWHHPYDDEQFLAGLSSEERERIQEAERDLKTSHGHANVDTTDDEAGDTKKHDQSSSFAQQGTELPPRPSGHDNKAKPSLGRKMKDKLTGTTHEQREHERAQREQQEREYYAAHMRFREALQRAQMTGQPQFLAKDRDGHDVYVEPPQNAYGNRYGSYGGGYGGNWNPYANPVYQNPNARFVRPPSGPYYRPYGPGYGGGYGMPIAGGLLGGMLLGGLLF